MSVVILDQISKSFGSLSVLKNLSLTVEAGELVALLGPSGSGKSTILKLIAGLEQPDQGDIQVNGQSILDTPIHQRRIVLMFQQAYLFPFLSVFDNIAFGLKARKQPPRQIKRLVSEALELVELPELEQRYPDQLSGGQQQRIALARALVVKPNVLLLDEPLSSLDPTIRANLQRVIRRIQCEQAITTLLVTHDRSEAFAMADRTAILLDGELTAIGPAETLFQQPPTEAAARFLGIDLFLHGVHKDNQLETADGCFQVSLVASQDERKCFAIRPEHLRLHRTNQPQTLMVHVRDMIYRGEYIEYRLQHNEELLTAQQKLEEPRFEAGETIFVELPAQYLFALQTDS